MYNECSVVIVTLLLKGNFKLYFFNRCSRVPKQVYVTIQGIMSCKLVIATASTDCRHLSALFLKYLDLAPFILFTFYLKSFYAKVVAGSYFSPFCRSTSNILFSNLNLPWTFINKIISSVRPFSSFGETYEQFIFIYKKI